jgi:hypothetical protein
VGHHDGSIAIRDVEVRTHPFFLLTYALWKFLLRESGFFMWFGGLGKNPAHVCCDDLFDWCFLFLIGDTSESPIFCGFGRMEMCCGRQQHIMQQWNVCTGLKKAIACRYVCGADFEQSRVWSSYVVSVELLSFCFVESIIIPSDLVLTPVKQLCFGGQF